jgi:hypothetical protein
VLYVLQEDLGYEARGGGSHRKAFSLDLYIIIVYEVILGCDSVIAI